MGDSLHYAPQSALEVERLVAEAAAGRHLLDVHGGDSKQGLWTQTASAARLDMSHVSGITDYDPDELVLTARAGTPLAELQAALAARGQMFAFEPFDHAALLGNAPGRATLGGIVAANVSGPRRISAGAARDHILGFTGVSGRGELLKGGGAVVKNVTGFDLPKLIAGSWGTLAVLTSITMRVLPRPRSEKTLVFRGLSAAAANRVMTHAMGLSAAVSCAAHVSADGGTTGLRIEGFGPSVDVRCRDVGAALAVHAACETREAEESALFWRDVQQLAALPVGGHSLWRIAVPPAQGAQVVGPLSGTEWPAVYDWAGGLVWLAVPDDPGDTRASDTRSTGIRAAARALGGHAIRIRGSGRHLGAPALGSLGARTDAPRDGAAVDSGLRRLQLRVKTAFDPAGILNAGIDPTAES